MKTITTIRDLQNLVDSWCHESLANETHTHEEVIERVARQLSHEAHIDGLRYGDDWSDWLEQVENDAIQKFLDGTGSQITPDKQRMNALEFANANENVIVRIAGNGCPAGIDIAWIPPETELPFDLEDIEGEVGEDGQFTATNLTSGSGAHDWKFSDHRGNIIYAIWLRVDKDVWQREYDELMSEV